MDAQEAFAEFIERNGLGIDPADQEAFENAYRQEWGSEVEFARVAVIDMGLGLGDLNGRQVESIGSLIDWKAVAKGMFQHGNFTFIQSDTDPSHGYVFESEV